MNSSFFLMWTIGFIDKRFARILQSGQRPIALDLVFKARTVGNLTSLGEQLFKIERQLCLERKSW
jgi:hypothetical protein